MKVERERRLKVFLGIEKSKLCLESQECLAIKGFKTSCLEIGYILCKCEVIFKTGFEIYMSLSYIR